MILLCYNALICFFSFTVIDTSQTAWCYLFFSYIYVDVHVPVNDALTAIYFVSYFTFTSTYTSGGVMKELHACFQWNTPEKGWIPSWIRVPWLIGEEEVCCVCVSCLNYIPWASRSLDTYYYYIYHYRILPSTFAYNMSMVSKAQSNLISLELSTIQQSPAISWLQNSLTAVSCQSTLFGDKAVTPNRP